MKKRVVRQVIAMFLCVCLSLGLFDGIPVVKEYVGTANEAEAADFSTAGCVKWVKYRASQTGISLPGTGYNSYGLAGASAYWDTLPSRGYARGSEPTVNALAVWKFSSTSAYRNYGHVAYVENVNGNSVTVSEGGLPSRYSYNGNTGARCITVSKGEMGTLGGCSGFLGYVYLTGAPITNYTISTNGASNISNNNARISGSMSPAGNVSSWGFYIGTNQNAMTKIPVGGTTYSGNMACNVGSYSSLKYGTTYYYKMWAIVNGQEKSGGVKSFRTTATKPDIPNLKISSSYQDIGLESSATVHWAAAKNAKYYKLYLYNSDNELIETSGQVTGTKYAFKAAEKTGTYYAQVEAYNEVGTKGKSNTVSFTVHPDVTVTFMDQDRFVDVPAESEPLELGKQTIHYGGTANAPADPEHTGYTFKKWSKSFSNVREDIVVKAEYEINQYTVRYVDSTTQEVIGTEKVDYYSSANPVDYELPTGYVKTGYDGWDKDYKCITANTTLNTCIGWYNENFPIYAELVSAVREYDAEESDNEGYTIQAKVTNWDQSSTKGRVVVALKTKEGKLLTSTESSAFSVKKSANKTIEVFVPYDKAASMAEIYVIGQYTDAVPITTTTSNNATLEIDQSSVFTNWSTVEPPEEATQKEERTEYRYQDKQTTTSYETSLSGYTCSGSSWVRTGGGNFDYVASFPYGFNTSNVHYSRYNKKPVAASETYTNKTTVSINTIGYLYYHWCRNGNYGAINRTVSGTYTSKFWNFHAFAGAALPWNSAGAFYGCYPSACGDSYWWIGYGEGNAANTPVYNCAYNNYRKLFNYYKWTDYSDWSTTKYTASSTRNVQERKVYRYLTDEMMKEDTSGEERTVEGSLGEAFAGKEATLFIYKVDEASDYTNEYVAQTKLDEEGNYSFTFKLREEPSVKTGDMTVVLGVEGNSTAIYLDTIKAPKKTHKVRFFDYNGKVISEQDVVDGYAAELPSQEETKRTGYTFTKWSDTNINITEDKDIYAEYELNKYDVVFVDWKANAVKVEEFEYGSRLVAPLAEEPDDSQVVEWDLIADGVETVTENLVVCTRYKTKTFDVKIQGFDGEIIDEQTVEYGKAVTLPEMDAEANNCIFYGWKNIAHGSEKEFTDVIIKEETILAPDFTYLETVSNPTASVASGEYDKTQTVSLSTETEGADIYYTLDGSDPQGTTAIRYTAPITVEDATVLRYYATADKKNDSEVCENFYVINYEGARSAWMPYADLPEEVKENQAEYDIYTDTGYALKEIKKASLAKEAKELERLGWTKDGYEWSEYSEWQDTPLVDEATYIEPEVETQPVYSTSTKYQYSHYVYTDGTATCYSAEEVEGKECKFETIELDKSMTIAGFKEDGSTYFVRDGVEWFNQKKVIGKTQTGTEYRYRSKIVSYAKWGNFSTDIPSEEEMSNYKESEVFSYVRHNHYIVDIYGLTNKLQTKIVEEGEQVSLSDLEKLEGYISDGIYTDAEFTQKWDPETDCVNSNLALYVKMEPEKYEVTFKDADGNEIETQQVAYLEEAKAPEPEEPKGEKFVGWSTQQYMCVTENIDVVAKYVPEEEYATISFDKAEMTMQQGDSSTLVSEISPLSQSETLVYWESEDNSVAIVSDQGVVTAIGEGETTIVATIDETGEKAECKIRVMRNGAVESSPAPSQTPHVGAGNCEESTTPLPSAMPSQVPGTTMMTASPTTQETVVPTTQETFGTSPLATTPPDTSVTAPSKVSKVKAKSTKKKTATISWKKVSNASGYQIQYALNKKFSKKEKKKLLTTNKATLKKLKRKKSYYVRVRAYRLDGTKKVYGKWSKRVKVKVK